MAWEFESPPGHQLERMSFDSNAEALFFISPPSSIKKSRSVTAPGLSFQRMTAEDGVARQASTKKISASGAFFLTLSMPFRQEALLL